jgi:SAM-dependent methyltransferase
VTDLKRLEKVWEGLAKEDPLWAILTDPERKGNKWRPVEFFETGTQEVKTVLDHLKAQALSLDFGGKALDFGCGAGRLTQALAVHFSDTVGVDISATMIELARKHNQFPDSCIYVCNTSNELPFGDNEFSFVYSSIVLQHIEPRFIGKYITEFLRVLKPGGTVVFQLADQRKGEHFVKFAGRIHAKLRATLVAAGLTKGRMEVHCFPETKVREILAGGRCQVKDIQITNSLARNFNGNLLYLPSEPQEGYVGKQYCIVRENGITVGQAKRP